MTPTPTPVIDKSDIILTSHLVQTAEVALKNGNDAPFGVYFIEVTVLDKEAKSIDTLIEMTAPNNYLKATQNEYKRRTGQTSGAGVSPITYGQTFSYSPQSSGKKTLIFTSGILTKTIEIDVK